MEESKKLAEEKGYKVIRCDATSAITSKLCEKLGMKMFEEIPYSSYMDRNLKPILKPPPPHGSLKIYVDVKQYYEPPITNKENSKDEATKIITN